MLELVKMEAAWSSERLVSSHNTWHVNPENYEFCLHCHENLKSCISTVLELKMRLKD